MSSDKKTIGITFDLNNLSSYTDEFLGMLWTVAQANPVSSFDSPDPGHIAESIGREIIRRWLVLTPPPLWDVQGRHFTQGQLDRLKKKMRGES